MDGPANAWARVTKVELLPSCVPTGDAQFLVTFVVNETVAIDAGSLGLIADLDRQRRVRHVLLTHGHLDHVATLPLFLENVHEPGPDCVDVLGQSQVLEVVGRDIFNGRVWPDVFALSTEEDRFVRATPLEPGVALQRVGLAVTPVPVAHCTETRWGCWSMTVAWPSPFPRTRGRPTASRRKQPPVPG